MVKLNSQVSPQFLTLWNKMPTSVLDDKKTTNINTPHIGTIKVEIWRGRVIRRVRWDDCEADIPDEKIRKGKLEAGAHRIK